MSMASSGKGILISSVSKLSRDLSELVKSGQKSFKCRTDINEYVRSPQGKMGPDIPLVGICGIYPVDLYVECFRSAKVMTRNELEESWSKHFHDSEVWECVEKLLAAEDSYRSLMEEIEHEMQLYEDQTAVPTVSVGDSIPSNLDLMETTSGEMVSLQSYFTKARYTLFILRKHFV